MGAKRRKLQERLTAAEETIEIQRESIERLRSDNAKLRNRPTVAALPEGDTDVYTVMVFDVHVEQDLMPVGVGGFVNYLPGPIRITLMCTGPQPERDTDLLQGGRFALIPVQDPR